MRVTLIDIDCSDIECGYIQKALSLCRLAAPAGGYFKQLKINLYYTLAFWLRLRVMFVTISSLSDVLNPKTMRSL